MKEASIGDKFRKLRMNEFPCPYLLLDLKGNVVEYNSDCAKLFGFRFADNQAVNISDYLCDGDRDRIPLLLEIIVTQRKVKRFAIQIQRLNGEWRLVELSASLVTDGNDVPVFINCILVEVGKERMFVDHLKEEVEVLGMFFENLPMGVALRTEGRMFSVNDTLSKVLEYSKEFLVNQYLPILWKSLGKSKDKSGGQSYRKVITGSGKKIMMKIRKYKLGGFSDTSKMEIILFEFDFEPMAKMLK